MEQQTRQEGTNPGFEAFSAVERAIVVCAHADDMETLMGGTAAMLAARGVVIYELICTQGDLGTHNLERYTRESLADTRRAEAQEGGRVLGLREVVTLDYHDGELEPLLALRAQIAHYYRKWQPDTLFTFDPGWDGQVHADHRAAGRAAIDALMPSRMEFYHPEQLHEATVANIQRAFLFSPAAPSIYVDVATVYPTKVEAALAHRSQFPEGDKNVEWMRNLDREAAKRANPACEYAEQFSLINLW